MSDNNKNTCPVCFTRMRNINKVLTCPECGYKYCDRSRTGENLFDTSHTHAPNYTTYTTYTNNTTSYQKNSSQTSTPNKTFANTYSSSGKTTYTNTNKSSGGTTSGRRTSTKSAGKVVRIIVIIYLLIMFCPMICSVLGTVITFGAALFSEDLVSEFSTSSDYTDEGLSPELQELLEEVDGDETISLESEDGDFIPELIEEMFDTNDWQDVTNREICNIYRLEINRDYDDNLYAYYYTRNGDSGRFDSEFSELELKDLNAFIGVEYLHTPSETYDGGDLDGLRLLKDLACKNSPAEAAKIVYDVEQITDLRLTLPDDCDSLDGLEQFTNLQSLQIDAYDSDVTNAQQIADLQNLYTLTYMDNGSLQDFEFLSRLSEINYLHLYTPGLKNLSFVENMPNLWNLEIWGSEVTDLSPLTYVTDTLTSLSIFNNIEITDFTPIADLTQLEYLTLNYVNLTDIDFASNLDNLVMLNVSNNEITSLEPIKDLPNLEYLYIYDNPIEDYAGLEELCE